MADATHPGNVRRGVLEVTGGEQFDSVQEIGFQKDRIARKAANDWRRTKTSTT